MMGIYLKVKKEVSYIGKDYNYGYVFLFYDVNEKRVQKVFKICKKYLSHHQNSVFRGTITPSKLINLKEELKSRTDPKEDNITIIKLFSERYFEEENIGIPRRAGESMFL